MPAKLSKAILSAFVLLGGLQSVYAKEWRGLVPLQSTRSDVIRLLNQCSDQKEACRFTLETERVHILFSGGLPAGDSECAARLTSEVIVFIEVQPQVKLKLADLSLDKRNLTQFSPSATIKAGLKGYRSSDGLVLSLYKDKILQIIYVPNEADRQRCPSYYGNLEHFVEVMRAHVHVIDRIDGPESIKAGEKLEISAYSSMNEIRGYTWEVSAGRIISGQFTKRITVDTTGLAGQTIVVTAEIGDVFGHFISASTKVRILVN